MKPEEIFADHENRISFLENSLSGSAMTPKEEEIEVKELPEKPWNKRQWDRVEQLMGEMANLKGKFLDSEKRILTLEKKSSAIRSDYD